MAAVYFIKSQSTNLSSQWDTLLKLLCNTKDASKFLLVLLKALVSDDDNVKWRNQHLNNLMSVLVQNLKSIENIELFKLLSFTGKSTLELSLLLL